MKRSSLIIYTVLVLYTVGPFLSMLVASAVAEQYGCRLDEAGVHPCLVVGKDIGGTLNTMFVFAWLGLVTLPSGALALVVYSIYLLFRKRRASSAS